MKQVRVWQWCAVIAVAASVTAAAAAGFKAKPWIYDPTDTGLVGSAWVTEEGLLDAGGSRHALFLSKTTATATNAASGATIDVPDGTQLTELGFDYRNDGHCGAGAPRFNVYTTAGTYFFGCSYGIHSSSPADADWTRVRFSPADAFPTLSDFSEVTVTGIDIVFDEGTDVGPGSVHLDNIDINGTLIGKPGLVVQQ